MLAPLKDRKYRTAAELARDLGKHPSTLCHWRKSGTGPGFVRVGGSVVYPLDKIEAWLSARAVDPQLPRAA